MARGAATVEIRAPALSPIPEPARRCNSIYSAPPDVLHRRSNGRGWRAIFFQSGFEHSLTSRAGAAWARSPWEAVQAAAADALRKRESPAPAPREVKAERLSELTARRPFYASPPETFVDKPSRVSLQLSGCTDHLLRIKHRPACSVEPIWPDNHRFVTRLCGQAAMNALRSVHAPYSHHTSAPSAVVACTIGHFKIVVATQAKCRHCDDL